MTARNERACKDCLVENLGKPMHRVKLRPATYPGPRCYTHHLAWQRQSKTKAHRRRTEDNFGLGEGGYDRLLEIQGGRCGGCGKTPGPAARRMAVDHDHACCPGKTSCGKCVRGLLCYHCNDTLATYRDDPAKLRGLADYLDHWPSRRADWHEDEDPYDVPTSTEARELMDGTA